ncbi:MAG TPA: PPC domain-containing DNA-binding protein [Gaiellaceae bacterium]|jgi:predicted DNA-binding protein with PD1-like motif|nr:PPC domain-containing DNA-binding protein [Gaiellaceae bacterium]
MRSKLLHEDGERTFALVFAKGDEALAGLQSFAREQGVTAARLTGIGAFADARLGYFDRERKDYVEIPVAEQVEVLSLLGDVAVEDDEPKVHVHAVLGRSDGTTLGGHLLEGHVWPTLEVVLDESPAHLRKRSDPETGLALIDPDA